MSCKQTAWSIWCLTLALGAAFVEPAQALTYYVKASTRVQTSGFGISDPQYHDDNTGQVQALSVTSGPFTVTSNQTNYATATAYDWSELGALHSYGSISASSANLTAGADSQNTGSGWGDTFTVVSNTLPSGSPVSLLATLTFHRTLAGSGASTIVQANASVTGPFSLSISDSLAQPNASQSSSATFTAFVDVPFLIQGQLFFQINGGASAGNSISGNIEASNTAVFNLVSLNSAASYTTASGVRYVPEPASLALLTIGTLHLGGLRRRPRRVPLALPKVLYTSRSLA